MVATWTSARPLKGFRMARPKKTDVPDLAQRCNLSAGAIERLICPPGKAQAFLRDTEAPSLRVRVTPAEAKSFVFEAKLNRQTIRRTLGDVREWSIEQARTEARRLAVLVDNGTDPRELDRQREADKAAATAQAALHAAAAAAAAEPARVTWERYLEERRPHWRERTFTDHLKVAQVGGRAKVRGEGVTQDGPLAPLLVLPLSDLTPAAVDTWAAREAQDRPARVRLALRMLKAFLRWAAAEPDLHNAKSKGFFARAADGTHLYVYNDGPTQRDRSWPGFPHGGRASLRYKTKPAGGAWSAEKTFFDAGTKNSYPTLVEVAPGEFRAVWDSGDATTPRTHVLFGKFSLKR